MIPSPLYTDKIIKKSKYPSGEVKDEAMKTILLNGSPRKNWNTALMLKEAQKGAASVGAETEYIDLFDLS